MKAIELAALQSNARLATMHLVNAMDPALDEKLRMQHTKAAHGLMSDLTRKIAERRLFVDIQEGRLDIPGERKVVGPSGAPGAPRFLPRYGYGIPQADPVEPVLAS